MCSIGPMVGCDCFTSPATMRPSDATVGWAGVTHVRRHHEHYHRRGQWTSLPRSIPKLSSGRGRVLSGLVPIRRGESAAREARRPGGTVAVERTVAANASRRRADPERVARQASVRLAGSGERPHAQGIARRTARARSTRPTVWSRGLGANYRRAAGTRFHPPRPRPPQDNRQPPKISDVPFFRSNHQKPVMSPFVAPLLSLVLFLSSHSAYQPMAQGAGA